MALPFATYSASALVGTLTDPSGNQYIFTGQKGVNRVTFERLTTRVTQQMTADGFANQSFQLGANARCSIEVVQTSDLNDFLLNWASLMDTALSAGSPDLANAGTFTFRHVVRGNSHTGIGVAIEKVPNMDYGGQAAMRVWPLLTCELIDG